LRLGGAAAAEKLAEDPGVARSRSGLRLEDQRRSSFAQHAATAPGVEGPQPLRAEKPELMVVEDHLGLDGRIVPDRQRAVGLSSA
jgi:hypothetical protein